MKKDARGLEVTTDSADVIAAVNDFTEQLIGLDKEIDSIITYAEQHPDNFLLQSYAAAFYLYGLSQEAMSLALPYINNAERLLKNANSREKAFFTVIKAWQACDYWHGISLLEAYAKEWPEDFVAIKVNEFFYFAMGQAYNGKRYLNYITPLMDKIPESSHIMACYSFALELSGDYELAKWAAEKALEIDPNTPWAHHTLAHSYINLGELEAGAKRLSDVSQTWRNKAPFILAHNAWHWALFDIEQLNFDRVDDFFNNWIWNSMPEINPVQVDGVSLLWRVEMAGGNVDKHWQTMAPYLEKNINDHYVPFLNAHYMYGLARAGKHDACETMLDNLTRHSQQQTGAYATYWDTIGLPLIEACYAHAKQDYPRVVELLNPIADGLQQVGGSDAQDTIFYQMLLSSLIETQHWPSARRILSQYVAQTKPSPLTQRWQEDIRD